jgi:hypothetical protein
MARYKDDAPAALNFSWAALNFPLAILRISITFHLA